MNETLIKYLAGLLDADGSLSLSFRCDENKEGRYYVGLNLRLASSDAVDQRGFVSALPQDTGMGTISRYGSKRQYISWNISKRSHLEMVLPRLIKHMVIKAQHWQYLLDVWREGRKESKTCSTEERIALTAASKESRRLRVGPIRPKNHPTWAWLAGYLDGDGWYTYTSGVYKGYRQWRMEVGACSHINDAGVLEFLQRSFGGRIKCHSQSNNAMVWKRALGYQNRTFALGFLSKLARHSHLKRHKIDAMIHHHRQRLSVPGTKVQAIV